MGRAKLLLLSLCSGALLAIPWMSGAGSWVLLIALVPLLLAEDQLSNDGSRGSLPFFFCSLLTFLTWNMLSAWWIGYVSLPGMLMINSINAFLMAGVWWLFHSFRRRVDPPTAYFALVIFWICFEYLHFNWSMQWPWLTLGHGFAGAAEWIQWYEYTGVLGGSLWILLANILFYTAVRHLKQASFHQAFGAAAVLFLWIAMPLGWSIYRYHTYLESDKRIQVAVLQPNIDPYKDKFSGMTYEEQARRLVALAQQIVNDSTRYVVAPETALEPLWENDSLRYQKSVRRLDTLLNGHPRLTVIAGAITRRKREGKEPVSYAVRRSDSGDLYEVYNSALYIDRSPEVQIGHKNILVSGVEKIPFQEYFSFLGNYAVNAGGTSGSLSPDTRPAVFKGANGEGIGAVICFESAFGSFVAESVKNGAHVLLVITNDGWWKESAGVAQHFGYSRLRAVENRRSIARSANTGLSGFISERGEVISKTSVNTATALSASVTLNDQLTFYVKHGDYLGWSSVVLAVMIAVFGWGRKREL